MYHSHMFAEDVAAVEVVTADLDVFFAFHRYGLGTSEYGTLRLMNL